MIFSLLPNPPPPPPPLPLPPPPPPIPPPPPPPPSLPSISLNFLPSRVYLQPPSLLPSLSPSPASFQSGTAHREDPASRPPILTINPSPSLCRRERGGRESEGKQEGAVMVKDEA